MRVVGGLLANCLHSTTMKEASEKMTRVRWLWRNADSYLQASSSACFVPNREKPAPPRLWGTSGYTSQPKHVRRITPSKSLSVFVDYTCLGG